MYDLHNSRVADVISLLNETWITDRRCSLAISLVVYLNDHNMYVHTYHIAARMKKADVRHLRVKTLLIHIHTYVYIITKNIRR